MRMFTVDVYLCSVVYFEGHWPSTLFRRAD